jgi:hypothetical protein
VPARRKVRERFLRQARADELTTGNTRRGSQRRFAVDLVRAERDELKTRSTRAGTAERQAVDRVEYDRRKARRADAETVREALSHRQTGASSPTAVVYVQSDAGPRVLFDAELSRRDLRRDARHLSLIGQLAEGRLSPGAFDAKVRQWRPVTVLGPPEIAGTYKFLSDPAAVLVLVEQLRGEEPEYIRYPNAALRRRRVR